MRDFLRKPVSNGNPREQALIRRWWYEEHGARGRLVWEYYLEGKYADAMWFPKEETQGEEQPGTNASDKYPLNGMRVVLCEAKLKLTPEVVGQALVYTRFALHAGANVERTIVFCESGDSPMQRAATELNLDLVIREL